MWTAERSLRVSVDPRPLSAPSGGKRSGIRTTRQTRVGVTEASTMFGVTPRALRFYEERGLIEVERDRSGSRVYGATARSRIRWIVALRQAHLGLGAISSILDQGDDVARDTAHRALLIQQRDAVARLDAVTKMLEALPSMPRLEPIDGAD